MTALQTEDLTVFYCYAHEDQKFREQLEQHLSNLKRLCHLKTWFDRQILPGENWERVLPVVCGLGKSDLIAGEYSEQFELGLPSLDGL